MWSSGKVDAIVRLEGVESFDVTSRNGKTLRNHCGESAAQSGAVLPDLTNADNDLLRVISAWPHLPAQARNAILAMLQDYDRGDGAPAG